MAGQTYEELFIAGISGGQIWQAPPGTTIPADLAAPALGWVDLGYLSEDGHAFTESMESTDIKVWPRTAIARTITTGQSAEAKFAFAQWNADTLAARFGGTWTAGVGGVATMTIPTVRALESMLLVDSTDGGRTYRYIWERAVITGFEEIAHKTGEPALLGMTCKILPVNATDWWELRSNDPAIVVGP